jgi:hypothetical protein
MQLRCICVMETRIHIYETSAIVSPTDDQSHCLLNINSYCQDKKIKHLVYVYKLYKTTAEEGCM